MKRHQLNALYFLIVVAWSLCCGEAANCNRWFGPAGTTHCINSRHYNGYQWATCRSDAYIRVTSKGRHLCADRSTTYCYYQCMLDEFDKEDGIVFSYCSCSPGSPQRTEGVQLPAWCYSPGGTDCSWYKKCLNKAYPACENDEDDYAIKYAQKFCELYNKNYNGFSSQAKQWINAVRKCLQVELVPMLDKRRSKTCKELKSRAFDSHSPCYLNPDDSSPSYCDLSFGDQLKVFWTIKSAFIQSFLPSLEGTLDVLSECTKEKINELVQATKSKIEEAVWKVPNKTLEITKRKVKNIIKELEIRIKTWLENPIPIPVQLDMFIKDDDWHKFFKRRKRSVTEDSQELERSYIAGKIVDAIALDKNWKENGVAWFAYANKETHQDADGNFKSIRILVADRFKYDLTQNSPSPLKQLVNMTTVLVDLSEAVLNGSQNLKVDGNSIEIAKMNGCLDWNCKELAFNVTSLELNGAESCQAMCSISLAYIVFLIITFLCVT